MNNPFISIIVGIILIILWIPASFWTEINNKNNRKETVKLREMLDKNKLVFEKDNILDYNTTTTITDTDLDIGNLQKYFDHDLNQYSNYYIKRNLEYKDKKDKKDDKTISVYSLDYKYINGMTIENYKYLVTKKGKQVFTKTETLDNGDIYTVTIFKLEEDAFNKIKKLSGLLQDGDSEQDNQYDMNIYEYYIASDVNEVKKILLTEKNADNLVKNGEVE